MTQPNVERGEPLFAVDTSRGFTDWLAGQSASLAVSTYQTGKVFLFGVDDAKKLWVYNRNVGRCLGLAADGRGFWVSSDAQLHRFDNLMQSGERDASGCDALYAPRFSYVTGDLDIHDIGVVPDGDPLFVNTLFNCLARPSRTHSFAPAWHPSFISRLVAEDRCHLNGLAMRNGEPAHVTATSTSDTYDGWRTQREAGGVVIDVASGNIIARGLSMPHSPRWYRGRLWVLNSGRGEFGWIDPASGAFEPIAFCPGYLRGLAFLGDHAVIGLSLPRDNKTFSGLGLDDQLAKRDVPARCGLYFIDLRSGSIIHSMVFSGVVTELYDVAVLQGVRQPAMIGFQGPEIRRMISLQAGEEDAGAAMGAFH
jgi:uncharacterized protein (TIGR03032 family)